MLTIFKYCGGLLTQIVLFWQSISLDGFRPFWYLIGLLLLTVFGLFLKGLLFSGVVGSSVSGTAGKVNVRVSKSSKRKQ